MGSLNLGKVAIAMIGLLAYQNRDKLGQVLRGDGKGDSPLGDILGGGGSGGLPGGLGDILDRFRGAGSGKKVDSWVRTGPNEPLEREDVEGAIDAETLDQLVAQTGMSREELLERLTKDIPEAIDKMTPDGQLPADNTNKKPTLLDDVT